MVCVVCSTQFFGQSRDEPATPCECGMRITKADYHWEIMRATDRAFAIRDAIAKRKASLPVTP